MKLGRSNSNRDSRSEARSDAARTVARTFVPTQAIRAELAEPCRNIGLTKSQTLVMSGIVLGKTDKEIGMDMGISHRTVSNHIAQILRHLHVTTRSGAVKVLIDVHFTCPHMAQCPVRRLPEIPPGHAIGTHRPEG